MLHLRQLGVLGGQHGLGVVAEAGAFDPGQVVADRVLRLDCYRHHHHGVLGHPIQHGEAVVADQPLQGKLADQRCPSQSLHRDQSMGDVIEPPQPRVRVGDRQAQHQRLAEIVAKRTAFPVVAGIGSCLQHCVGIAILSRRVGVEPAEHPLTLDGLILCYIKPSFPLLTRQSPCP